jgi:hypothetical protein
VNLGSRKYVIWIGLGWMRLDETREDGWMDGWMGLAFICSISSRCTSVVVSPVSDDVVGVKTP